MTIKAWINYLFFPLGEIIELNIAQNIGFNDLVQMLITFYDSANITSITNLANFTLHFHFVSNI